MKFELASDKSIEGAERQENIEEFMSGLHDFVDTKREEGYEDEVYIANFLQEVALLTDSDEENDDDNDASSNERVSLMTIHASKGLEFNSVFVVGLEENIFPSPRSCSSIRELEEERRLLYVAITRAEQRCFLSCAKSRYQYGSMMFNEPSRFLKEIDKQYLVVEGNVAGFKSSERQPQPFCHVRNLSHIVKRRSAIHFKALCLLVSVVCSQCLSAFRLRRQLSVRKPQLLHNDRPYMPVPVLSISALDLELLLL